MHVDTNVRSLVVLFVGCLMQCSMYVSLKGTPIIRDIRRILGAYQGQYYYPGQFPNTLTEYTVAMLLGLPLPLSLARPFGIA